MREENMDVRLEISSKMDSGNSSEQGLIRIPRKARLYFNSKGSRLVLSIKGKRRVFEVKPAFKPDITALAAKVKAGTLSEEKARTTGFVTTATFQSFLGKEVRPSRKKCYLSESIDDIMIGADPEFALVNPGNKKFKYAEHISGLTINGELGHDGPLAEIRPPPSIEVGEMVKTISRIFKRDSGKISKYMWMGGAAYKSPNHQPGERIVHIGGHLQYGNPLLLPTGQTHAIYKQTVRILDELIALPMVRFDGPLPAHRRNEKWEGYGKYGRWSDFKAKENRFEWRVPSGLWLIHPDLTQTIMGASKAVVEACYQSMANQGFNNDWLCAAMGKKGFLRHWGVLPQKEVEPLINKADPELITTALLSRSAKKLRGLSNYTKYKAEIDEFIRIFRMNKKDRSNFNLDLKANWLNRGKLLVG